MDDALPWRLRFRRQHNPPAEPQPSATARFGGNGNDEPVLIAIVNGPVEIEMAQAALQDEGIPVLLKRKRVGPAVIIGMAALESAEVWVPPPFAEKARDTLIGVGLLEAE